MKKAMPTDKSGQASEPVQTLAERIAGKIRERVISGCLTAGSHLSEIALCDELGISRNTLREVFRLLTKEGLLRHEANRGVFVSTPSMASIVDIYNVRRMIECQAIANAHPRHPGVAKMRAAVEEAVRYRDAGEWLQAGTADIAYHAAVVELADSPRLNAFFAQIALELRLVFGLLRDPEYLHARYVDKNLLILSELEAGQTAKAADILRDYLFDAERFILGAYSRLGS
ncbi:GntR family transcriptional regulator [Rhizobium sp. FKY42]|uniref:GntR family transcriptional regulator n=1 Tax=Rhizobium sp. FKY42 TaxID=2562310 RepID=UPI0010BF74AE|nr:GntR family transcriptional regulator [Rhizobium sp. FKY42]